MEFILQAILAAVAVAAVAWRPRSAVASGVVGAAALIDIATGVAVMPALAVVAPLLAFLAAALSLAALVERSGLADRGAFLLAAWACGSTLALYGLTCLLAALLTAAVSLDGAVVLMVPLLRVLARAHRAPFAPFFLGVVAVCNAASIAVPQGNPTNLVLMSRLGLSPADFIAHMLGPGLAAAVLCAGTVALLERAALAPGYRSRPRPALPFSREERGVMLALVAAALAGWLAPLAGLAPWWPFSIAVALALLVRRPRPTLIVPWRIALQVGGLLVVLQALTLNVRPPAVPSLAALLALALLVGLASAIANNLPTGVSAAALLTTAPAAYGASIGLAVGALATSQGSVATMIAADLAGRDAPPHALRRFAPLACGAVLLATLVLWTTLA